MVQGPDGIWKVPAVRFRRRKIRSGPQATATRVRRWNPPPGSRVERGLWDLSRGRWIVRVTGGWHTIPGSPRRSLIDRSWLLENATINQARAFARKARGEVNAEVGRRWPGS